MLKKPALYEKVPDLARRLGVSRSTIWRWAKAKDPIIDVRRLGPRLFVRARLRADPADK